MKTKIIKTTLIIKIALVCVIVACLLHSCVNTINRLELDTETVHISPEGKELILNDGMFTCPSIYYNGELVWDQGGPVSESMTNITITWVSENEIIVSDTVYDWEDTVVIP